MKILHRILVMTGLAGLLCVSGGSFAQPYVCVDTNRGEFCMELLSEAAPNTVENFLNYVNDGDFDNTMIHRTVPQFIIQGGGYSLDPLGEEVPQDPQITNEFNISNTRGTVAMAKFPNQPDSASNEWFVNLADNSATLDFSNGGYTVFARIVNGMDVVDAIGNSLRADLSSSLGEVFTQVPVLRKDDEGVGIEDFITINTVAVVESVEEEPLDPEEDDELDEEEEEQLYQCTADWVSSLAPENVCLDTNLGEFCVDLLTESAPNTVANFLHYVADGDYDNTIIHRNDQGFVIQGGGFLANPPGRQISIDSAIANEFSVSNTRGTLAMAKISGDPDSATSQWFVNLSDNSAILDSDNGGYTVFARMIDDGMTVADTISEQPVFDLSFLGNALGSMPVIQKENDDSLSTDDFVTVERAYIPGAPANPCLPEVVPALTEFSGNTLSVPTRVGDRLYRIILNLQSIPPDYVFTVDLFRIIALTDVGQEVAVFDQDSGRLSIPSIRIGSNIVTDVVLNLTDSQTLEFTLASFTPPDNAGSE